MSRTAVGNPELPDIGPRRKTLRQRPPGAAKRPIHRNPWPVAQRPYFLAWGRDADENGPERDDTIGKIVSIESRFVELEILSVNGHDIEQEGTILSSLDELELRKTLEAAKDHYKKVRADIASQEAGKHGRGNKVVDFGGPRPKRR
jgi:hypothetical protein